MANNPNQIIKFKNGLQINVIKMPESKLSGIVIKIHLKEQYKNGIPHLFEHLVIDQIKKPSFLNVIGSTTLRFIAFKIIGIEDDIYDFLTKFVYNLSSFQLTDKNLESEKSIVKQELLQYRTSQLEKFASEARNKMFDSNGEYQDSVLGSLDDIDDITLEKVLKFAKNNLTAKNISCLATGNHVDNVVSILKQLDSLPVYTSKNIAFNKSKNILLAKSYSCKGTIANAQVANVSMIFKLTDSNLSTVKIYALSLFFSILTSGENALILQLRKSNHQIYFIKALPIYRYNSVYIQLILSGLPNEAKGIVIDLKHIMFNFERTSKKILRDAFKNLYFQQNVLFDGVEHSVNSFSNMEYEQEKITSFEGVKYHEIINEYNKLISKMLLELNNINIFVEYN